MEIVLPIRAHAKERPRLGYGRGHNTDRNKEFEELVGWQYLKAGGKKFGKSLIKMEIDFGFQVPKSYSKPKKEQALRGEIRPTKCDIDNLLKSVLDGLNKIAYDDDRTIAEISSKKIFANTDYIRIKIEEI